jgi:hypothetical protein
VVEWTGESLAKEGTNEAERTTRKSAKNTTATGETSKGLTEADLLRSDGVEHHRSGKDRRAREDSGELGTELVTGPTDQESRSIRPRPPPSLADNSTGVRARRAKLVIAQPTSDLDLRDELDRRPSGPGNATRTRANERGDGG